MNTSIYARQWDVGSFTDSTKKPYKVSERQDGRWECSCPRWINHMPRTDCKHIDKVKRAVALNPTSSVFTVPNTPPIRVTAPPVAIEAGDILAEIRNKIQPKPATTTKPPAAEPPTTVVFENYTIRRRSLDDTLTSSDTDTVTTRRSRREL
jgi:hypothetical protein